MSTTPDESERLRRYTEALLDDLTALERMLEEERFEQDLRRVGAEQEMFLVDRDFRPASSALEVLEAARDPRLTTELATFNLEANLTPRRFHGDSLSQLEAELEEVLGVVRSAAGSVGTDVVLVGILPTLRPGDITLERMTPKARYRALNDEMRRLRGGHFDLAIKGIDELQSTCDTVMYEACNTSFQLHFQVRPDEFARLYNIAQVITAPVLAAAANSPVFLGRRLWSETRIALFPSAVDSRSHAHRQRGMPPRVSFGESWVERSVLEVFREQVARFRIVLPTDIAERPLDVLSAGGVPRLAALCLHNGTTYRWNRACYGISDGAPHLRIEARAFPAGPTVPDEVANAALFFGLLSAFSHQTDAPPVQKLMRFADAKRNFYAAAQHGLNAQFTWLDGCPRAASALILDELLPFAREGLEAAQIDRGDIDRYTGIVEERVRSGRTGARWALDSLAAMPADTTGEVRSQELVAAMIEHQRRSAPVHTWPLRRPGHHADWRASYRTVEQVMSTDLLTVRQGDPVTLAANMMDWRHIQHVLVEDDDGHLLGVVTHRSILRLVARQTLSRDLLVEDLMKTRPVVVTPATPTLDAMRLMREHRVGCLPVVADGKLVGIVTQTDLIGVSARLLEEYLAEG